MCVRLRHHPTPSRSSVWMAALRIVGWNAALLLFGIAALTLGGEAWLRVTKPFMFSSSEKRFVPGVGPMFVPGSATRLTDGQFFWTTSTVNALGFVDRPPPPEVAAPGCRVTVIGDSFVVARQIPIADKFHVRLEALAATALPHLRVKTAAFGLPSTGQINQLPLYDNFARAPRPRVVVLVFVANDFADNSPTLQALSEGTHPRRQRWLAAARAEDGGILLRPPVADYADTSRFAPEEASLFHQYLGWLPATLRNPLRRLVRGSWFVQRLYRPLWRSAAIDRMKRADLLDSRVDLRDWRSYPQLLEARPITQADLAGRAFAADALAPIYEEAMAFTGFAFDQFQARAERDGARLLILASHNTRLHGERVHARLAALAAARGIPVIDQHDYIVRQGASPQTDAHWPTDGHWNAAGHQWAAEAVLEHLTRHEETCAGGVSA